VIHGQIAWHSRLIIGMVPAALADNGRLVKAFPEILDLSGVVAIAISQWALLVTANLTGLWHRMTLSFIDLASRDIKDSVAARPPLVNATTLSARRGAAVRIMLIEERVHPSTPLLSDIMIAILPAFSAVDFVDNKPKEQSTAIPPAGNDIAIELFLVLPSLFAPEEVNRIGHKVVGVGSVSGVSATPNSL